MRRVLAMMSGTLYRFADAYLLGIDQRHFRGEQDLKEHGRQSRSHRGGAQLVGHGCRADDDAAVRPGSFARSRAHEDGSFAGDEAPFSCCVELRGRDAA